MPEISEQEIALLHHYVCEGIGDSQRLRLLYLVAEQARNVTELTQALDISQPAVSHHLRILRERHLVKAERDGTSIYYSLSERRILQAMDIMRSFVKDLQHNPRFVMNNRMRLSGFMSKCQGVACWRPKPLRYQSHFVTKRDEKRAYIAHKTKRFR